MLTQTTLIITIEPDERLAGQNLMLHRKHLASCKPCNALKSDVSVLQLLALRWDFIFI